MIEIIKMDDATQCGRCGGCAHDVIAYNKGELTLQCVYCLNFSYVIGEMPVSVTKPAGDGSYVLKYGRHSGKSIKEVADLGERGIEYLRLLAKDSPKLRNTIISYIESRSAVSVKAAPV